MSLPDRKHPTHGILFVDGQPTVVFDTVCTKHRGRWLCDTNVMQRLVEIWKQADAWLVGRFMLMPDHVHYFAWCRESNIPFENWGKYWKSQFTKSHQHSEYRWQTDHWDTRIRNETDYEDRWNYVVCNPVRAGLVKSSDCWPYQGEVHRLNWR